MTNAFSKPDASDDGELTDAIKDLQFWIDHPSLDSDDSSLSPEELENLKHDIEFGRPLLEKYGKKPLKVIGAGAFGIVFRAHDAQLKRDVAIKILRESARNLPGRRSRFTLEAESMARCAGGGVVAVYEHGKLDDSPYIAMQLVDGPNLREYMYKRGRPLLDRVAAKLVAQVARAVHEMHQRAILHRDLKPSNILLDKGGRLDEEFPFRPLVSDFGFVKKFGLSGVTEHSVSEAVVGTIKYMSPEQATGKGEFLRVGTDVFSLGVILFELLTLQCPFPGRTSFEVLHRIVHAEPDSMAKLRPGVSRDLEAIVYKCLQKHPEDRYASAGALVSDLECFLNDEPTLAKPAGSLRRLHLWTRRNRLLAVLLLLVAIAIPTALGTLVVLYKYERDSARLAQEASAKANAESTVARKSAELAVQLLRQNFNRLAEDYVNMPGGATKRLELHLEALKGYEKLAEIRNYDPFSRHQLSTAYHWVASAYEPAGFLAESIVTRKKGVDLLDALVEEFPRDDDYRFDRFYNRRVLAFHVTDSIGEWLRAYEDIDIVCQHQPNVPDYQDARNAMQATLAFAYFEEEPIKAANFADLAIKNAIALTDRFPDKPIYLKPARDASETLGRIYSAEKRIEKMKTAIQQALDFHQRISTTPGFESSWVSEELHVRSVFMKCLKDNADPSLAGEIERALPLFDAENRYRTPNSAMMNVESIVRLWLAEAYWRSDRPEEAKAQYEKALALHKTIETRGDAAKIDFQAYKDALSAAEENRKKSN